jgi:hypothetical protein
MTTNIYVIKLQHDKYYIGHAVNLEKRLNEHAEGTASKYTRKYKPINIKKIIPDSDPKHLDKYVMTYMDKYGMNSVRGGSFEDEILTRDRISFLVSQGIEENKNKDKHKSKEKVKEINYDDQLSLQEKQMLDQLKYKEEIMQQPEQIMQRRRPESSLKQDVKKIPIRQANGTCWICGLDGHYKEQCTQNQEIVGYEVEEINELDMFFKPNLRN